MKYDEIINKIKCGEIYSQYSHSNKIDRVNGHDFLQFDCSGFVAWYIGINGYLRALAEVRNQLKDTDFIKVNRFYCQDFERFYQNSGNLKYWEIHKDIFDIKPGDILVVVYDDANGHMMIVDSILGRNENTLELRIVDSTRLHHKNDTRSGEQTGIGCGDIKITKSGNNIVYDSQNPDRTPTNVNIYIARAIK